MSTSRSADKSNAPAVDRAIRILGLLTESHGQPLGVSDIARALGIAKSSTANLCNSLEEGRMVHRTDSGYVLGRRTVELGGAYLATFDQVRDFYRICSESSVLSHELVQIAILDGVDVLYLARHEGRAPLRLSASIGDRYPASATAVGNALLSLLPDDEIRQRFASPDTRPRLTQATDTTLDGLLRTIGAARDRGFALEEGQVHPSVVGMAMVIPPRASGEAPLALGVSVMVHTLTPTRLKRIERELRGAVTQLANPMVQIAGS